MSKSGISDNRNHGIPEIPRPGTEIQLSVKQHKINKSINFPYAFRFCLLQLLTNSALHWQSSVCRVLDMVIVLGLRGGEGGGEVKGDSYINVTRVIMVPFIRG